MTLFRRLSLLLVIAFVTAATVVADAEARRLGGGRSIGRQSDNVSQREAPAPQRAPAQQQAAGNPAQGQQAGAPPQQPPRNRWLGPVAGLAAGLGIAALLSHFGLAGAAAEMLGSLLLIALLVMAVLFVVRMLKGGGRPAPAQRPAYAGMGGGTPPREQPPQTANVLPMKAASGPSTAPAGYSGPVSVTGEPLAPLPTDSAPTATWSVPADFDVEGFLRVAKVQFVRMQAAWDAGNLDDIREFTTPEMFAEIKVDLADRGSAANQTDVVHVDAELLGIEDLGRQALASVRFSGTLREAPGAEPTPFREVWNLVKPLSGRSGWLLGGIQQELQ